jgi:hypothetical protein
MVLRRKAPSTWPWGPCTYAATHPSPLSMQSNIIPLPRNSPSHPVAELRWHHYSWGALIGFVSLTLTPPWTCGTQVAQSGIMPRLTISHEPHSLVLSHCTLQDTIQSTFELAWLWSEFCFPFCKTLNFLWYGYFSFIAIYLHIYPCALNCNPWPDKAFESNIEILAHPLRKLITTTWHFWFSHS